MRMKSYFADSVEEAIDQARNQLGSDVMLISSSRTDADLKGLGAYEVVIGLADSVKPMPDSRDSKSASPKRNVETAPPGDRVLLELAALRDQMELLRHSIGGSIPSRTPGQFTPELRGIFNRLLEAGFSSELAHRLTEAVSARIEPHRRKTVRMIREHRDVFARDLHDALVTEEIESRFHTEAEVKPAVMFVGPPGAGKTSSLVKLAFQHGARARRPLRFLSADTLRIGASDQLEAYARILAARFEVVEHLSSLAGNVNRDRLTFIDTPGFSAGDESQIEQLAQAAEGAGIDVQLVMPASLALPVAERVWKRFAILSPSALLLTHADEVNSAGTLVELSIRSGLPLSFFGTGQQVPEHIREAQKPELIEQLLPALRAASVAA